MTHFEDADGCWVEETWDWYGSSVRWSTGLASIKPCRAEPRVWWYTRKMEDGAVLHHGIHTWPKKGWTWYEDQVIAFEVEEA